jgi:hypothetical protein
MVVSKGAVKLDEQGCFNGRFKGSSQVRLAGLFQRPCQRWRVIAPPSPFFLFSQTKKEERKEER